MQRLPTALTAVILAACTVSALAAAPSSASITVGATVRPFARIESVQTRTSLRITAEDVARGWVEPAGTTRLTVRTSSPRGYRLDIRNENDAIWLTTVRGLPGADECASST